MTASIAHELGNPLTAIVADCDALRRRALERSAAGEDRADDLRSTERLSAAAATRAEAYVARFRAQWESGGPEARRWALRCRARRK